MAGRGRRPAARPNPEKHSVAPMPLSFPTVEVLAAAVARHLLPWRTLWSPARGAVLPGGAVWVDSPTLPPMRKLVRLDALGVAVVPASAPEPDGVGDHANWFAVVPPAHVPGEASVPPGEAILFDAGTRERFVGLLRGLARFGAPPAAFAVVGAHHLVRAVDPPAPVWRRFADETPGSILAERAAGLWLPLGWRHPLERARRCRPARPSWSGRAARGTSSRDWRSARSRRAALSPWRSPLPPPRSWRGRGCRCASACGRPRRATRRRCGSSRGTPTTPCGTSPAPSTRPSPSATNSPASVRRGPRDWCCVWRPASGRRRRPARRSRRCCGCATCSCRTAGRRPRRCGGTPPAPPSAGPGGRRGWRASATGGTSGRWRPNRSAPWPSGSPTSPRRRAR